MKIFVTSAGELDQKSNILYAEDYSKVAKQIRDGTYEFADWLEKQGAQFIGITKDGLTYKTDDNNFQKLLDLFGFRRQNGDIQKGKGKQRTRRSTNGNHHPNSSPHQ